MKKTIKILLFVLSVCIISCSDDDKTGSELKVLSSNVSFDTKGGSGTIEVAATGTVNAVSNREWCVANVAGNSISVDVKENNAIEGRTAVITITSGTSQTQVPVSQGGSIVFYNRLEQGQILPYEGGSVSVEFSTNANFHIDIPEEAKSWLSYSLNPEERTLTFIALPSLDNEPRGAAVTINTGGKTIVYHVGSYELKDIAGNWDISFSDSDNEPLQESIQVYTSPTDETAFYIDNILDYKLPLVFKDGALRIVAGTSVGRFLSYYLYTVAWTENGSVTWSPSYSYVAYPSSINGKFALVFGDDGSYAGSDYIIGIAYWAFSGTPPSSNNSAGYYDVIMDLILSK